VAEGRAPCAVHCISIYEHGIGMSLFGLEVQIFKFTFSVWGWGWGPLATNLANYIRNKCSINANLVFRVLGFRV